MNPAALIDPQLAGLAEALDLERMSAELTPFAFCQSGGAASVWRVTAVDLLKYKPGRRCALAYQLESSAGTLRLFAKTFSSHRGAAILLSMGRFWQALDSHSLRIPRPLGYLANLKLLVTEFVAGVPLATELYRGTSAEAPRRMAQALAAVHASDVPCANQWSVELELENSEKWIAGLIGGAAPAAAQARALLEQLRSWGKRREPPVAGPVHRDFYLDQLLDCEGHTVLLDLDDASCGDPALDVGNFLAHLVLRPIQFPDIVPACRRARESFVSEYLSRTGAADTSFQDRARFYEATSLLRLAGVYAGRPRWADLVPQPLLDACQQILRQDRHPESWPC